MEWINGVISACNSALWKGLVYLCLLSGLYFSLRTNFMQVRLLKPMIKLMFEGERSAKGISSFQALALSLSGRIGTGNIAGTATAIFYGGPGALFWMWVIAFLGAASAYAEACLAQIWKREIDGQYRGGPAYYIEQGLGSKWYAVLFSFATILACGILLPGVQANAVTLAMENAFEIKTAVSGMVIALLMALLIFGGVKRIVKTAEGVVPFMAIFYIAVALLIIIVYLPRLPEVLRVIFSSAFSFDATFGGIIGSAVAWGVKRGIYSNEAGQGSAPHAAAAAEISHPVKQGLVQAFSVYIDTLFICSATGFMILLTNCFNVNGVVEHLPGVEAGPAYTQAAVSTLFPAFGPIFVAIALAFFAFATIMAYYYIAESNIAYIFEEKKTRAAVTTGFRLLFIIFVFMGGAGSAKTAWNMGDIGVGVMSWLNIIAILLLQKPALSLLKDYEKQARRGTNPVFDPDVLGIKNAGLWKKINSGRFK